MPASRLVLLVVLTLGIHAAPAAASEPSEPWRPFAPDSVWNLPLRADVRLNPNSAAYVASLSKLVAAHGAWINSSRCSMPLYWGRSTTPTQRVSLQHPAYRDPRLIRAWRAVPIPGHARPADCSDRNMAVGLRRRDGRVSVWEFWRARRTMAHGRPAWRATWGGYTDDVRRDRGVASNLAWRAKGKGWGYRSDAQWNVTASSISMIAGVITRQDLAAGRINHALSMAASDTAQGTWFFPAQRTDGSSSDPDAIPEGAHLRLDPSLNLDQLKLTPLVRMIAEAAQRYGIVVRDKTYTANVFYTDGRAGESSRIGPLLRGLSPGAALKAFPWDRLQLVAAPLCIKKYGRCRVTPSAVIAADGDRLDTSNSALNQPRQSVAWDLDGNGSYETKTARRVTVRMPTGKAMPAAVGVRIRTFDGETVTASKRLDVAPANALVMALVTRSLNALVQFLRRYSPP